MTMTTTEFLVWLQQSPVSQAVSKSSFLVGAGLQIVHIFGIFLLLTAILLISLRLLGIVLREQPVTLVSRTVTRFIWIGLVLLVVSGFLMFITTPLRYAHNSPFLIKMALLLVAVPLQLLLFRRVAAQDAPNVVLARSTAVATVAVWVTVAGFGRFIGFV